MQAGEQSHTCPGCPISIFLVFHRNPESLCGAAAASSVARGARISWRMLDETCLMPQPLCRSCSRVAVDCAESANNTCVLVVCGLSSVLCYMGSLKRRFSLAPALLLYLLQASLRIVDSSHDTAAATGGVSFAANSAGSDGEFQAPELNPQGWEVKKFEQVQRCLACRYVQETAAEDVESDEASSKIFGKLMTQSCPSLPPFVRGPCNDAAAAINRMSAASASSDICHAAMVCSVPLIDPFETAKLLASTCEPSRCTIYHHVGLLASAAHPFLTPPLTGASQHCGWQHVALALADSDSHAANCAFYIWSAP